MTSWCSTSFTPNPVNRQTYTCGSWSTMTTDAGWYLVIANLNGTYLAFQCKVWAYSADDAKQKFTGFVLGVRKFNAAELVVTVVKGNNGSED